MRHIHQQQGADFVCDLAETGPVPETRIGGAPGDDELGPVFARDPRHIVHVDAVIVLAHAIGNGLEPFARHVDRRTVRQMPPRREIEAHERVARLQQRKEHRLVHLAAAVGLHIREIAAEKLLGAFDRDRLDLVDIFAAAIIAAAGIAFGIFVGQD